MSILCAASMLPCGRYYYEPEGGYVGNPWVKFSYQYIYLYMAWIIHHLDLVDHYIFQFYQVFLQKIAKLYKKYPKLLKISNSKLYANAYRNLATKLRSIVTGDLKFKTKKAR
jgi:hypothetical protein